MARPQCDTPPCFSASWGEAAVWKNRIPCAHPYSNKGCGLGPQSLQTTYACHDKVCTCKFAKMYHLVKKIGQEHKGLEYEWWRF
jgi:hypothetical protein